MKTQFINRQTSFILLTMLLALFYALPALAGMKTTVIEKKKTRGKIQECAVKVQYPTDAASPLAKAINSYISEKLGGTSRDNPFDVPMMAARYLEGCLEPSEDEIEEEWEDRPPNESSIKISKLAETDTFVTYEFTEYFYGGGPHGYMQYDGMTFRKSDGQRMGWNAFVKTHGPGFKNLLKQGLKESMQIKTDKELAGELTIEGGLKALPLPKASPLFMEKGVKFTYGEYEIAAYASGMPEAFIPYARLAPYMTSAARKMTGASNKSSKNDTIEPVTGRPVHLTDAMHRQFLRDSAAYRAADAHLTTAWKQTKKRLSPQRFQEALAAQRAWVKSGRDIEAARFSGLSPVDAFTRATEERARELERL